MKRLPAIPRPRRALRDASLGLGLFALALAYSGGGDPWSIGRAAAADSVTRTVVLATSPPGHDTENAVLAALLQPAPAHAKHLAKLAILGFGFALLFAFNMTVARHLRRVYASPRRDGWRRGR